MFDVEARLARPGRRHVSVVLKVAERCNLACTYCYFFFGGDDSYLKHPALISSDRVSDVARFLGEAAIKHRLERIEIALHGGEPLLLKPDRMGALVETIRAAVPDSCEVDILLQTNGVLVDETWIALFEQHSIGIGVSLDGPRAVNDIARLDKKGRSSFDATIAGWGLLKKAAADGRISEPGILSVIAPTTDAETLSFFIDELGAHSLNFLLPDMFFDNPETQPEDVARIGETMIAIFEEWRRRADPGLHIRFVNDALLPMIVAIPAESTHHCREDLSHAMTIASDGTIYVEDTIRSAFADRFDETLNVASATLADVFAHPHWQSIARAAEQPAGPCTSCRYGEICQGGPLISRYSSDRGFDNPSLYCSALFAFHRHVEREVSATGRLLPSPRFAADPLFPARKEVA
ncbi:radical SAM protein [Erythrobacter sp. JK5]|uniref:radical SAM protein n=1 Tax=Erythrobacter sp. JK5 TaxID=2829500 RepID=UPI001BA7F4DF|nr:radical SAM protein [Erythrobacter sp. JK5]QUL38779.1 radical SAM protein [Erythrobacter sp. JK5]